MVGQGQLVGADAVHPDVAQVGDGRRQPHGLGDGRRARLEAGRRRRRPEGVELHVEDHAAAAEEGRHGLEQLGAAPQDADAGRAHHLVGREGEEVDAERARRRPARAGRAARRRPPRSHRRACATVGDVAHGVDGAEHVGHGRDADELDAVDQAVEVVEHEAAVVVDRDVAQVEAAELLGEDHPRHDVGVVLHLGQQHGVARAAGWPGPRTVRHQVERLGRVLGEDDLVRRVRRADEASRRPAGPARRARWPPRPWRRRRGARWRASSRSSASWRR